MTPEVHRGRVTSADRLHYAFSADGSLDPGTRLLDIGLDEDTPMGALRKLAAEPLHMSLALHEITHFVSLENMLGELLAVYALLANTTGNSLFNIASAGGELDAGAVDYYCALRGRYAFLMEAWRPLLEGLAVFVQTHSADERSDALVLPLFLLWFWKVSICGLGDQALDGDFLLAGYRGIREGPRLRHDRRPLAASIEMLEPETLRPYFLGHSYLRAVQRRLARADSAYHSAEKFVAFILRVLRSSTRRLLSGNPDWDKPGAAERIYNWIEIVSGAPTDRIAALDEQDDRVDVLHFLATGEAVTGYSPKEDEIIGDLQALVPDVWNALVQTMRRMHFDEIAAESGDPPIAWSDGEIADRILRGFLRATMTLNLSTGGRGKVSGWVEKGLGTRHALAIEMDSEMWWLAATDADVALLVPAPEDLPRLERSAMVSGKLPDFPRAGPPILVNSFASYLKLRGEEDFGKPSQWFPRLRFELQRPQIHDRSVLATLSSALPGVVRSHITSVEDSDAQVFHANSEEIRRIIACAPSPQNLARQLEAHRKGTVAAAVRASASRHDLALARVQAHTERRILRGLLGRVPGPHDLQLLSKGVRMFTAGAQAGPLITGVYGTWAVPDREDAEVIGSLNKEAEGAIGKRLFEWDSEHRRVSYCGIWGDAA